MSLNFSEEAFLRKPLSVPEVVWPEKNNSQEFIKKKEAHGINNTELIMSLREEERYLDLFQFGDEKSFRWDLQKNLEHFTKKENSKEFNDEEILLPIVPVKDPGYFSYNLRSDSLLEESDSYEWDEDENEVALKKRRKPKFRKRRVSKAIRHFSGSKNSLKATKGCAKGGITHEDKTSEDDEDGGEESSSSGIKTSVSSSADYSTDWETLDEDESDEIHEEQIND